MIPTNTPFRSTGNFFILFFPNIAAIFSISAFHGTVWTDLFFTISLTFKSSILFTLSSNSSSSPLMTSINYIVPIFEWLDCIT